MKTLIISLTAAAVALVAGYAWGQRSAVRSSFAENSISMLVVVGDYYRGSNPERSEQKIDESYHRSLALLALSGQSRTELFEQHPALPALLRILREGREKRNLPLFDPASLPGGASPQVEEFLRDLFEFKKEANQTAQTTRRGCAPTRV